ncbi:hypothetical protein EJ110_NYTH25126 [Nymphaea thermarum]|nr:hypothetical protein EJ110_NYTH25126 [Nymphaea thermarum]
MAELMGSPKDAGLDAGSASKVENVSIQVTSIRLTKDNYLSWSAALEIGITSRGRLSYITGDKPAPLKYDPQWATWALEDSQVKVWIISSVSSDIQPLILRKPTSFDMWTVLAKMYGRKKRHLRTYQIKRSIYSLTQGDLSVAAFYAALKTKWEELDYHVTDEWKCGSDHSLYWEKEWMDRTFLFLGGLRDEFEAIRSQILNGDEIPGIEEVYARVESEEQRRQVMHLTTGSVPSAFVSRASGTVQRPARRCTHCNKLGHSADFCWDLHPEKRLVRGRPPSGRRSPSLSDSGQGTPSSGVKTKLSPNQLKELQAYIGRLSTTPEESSTVSATVSNEMDSQMEATVSNEMDSQMEGVTADARDHLFGQVYVRKEKATVEDVVEEDRTNPNHAISLDDPSPPNEELSIALHKGTSDARVSALVASGGRGRSFSRGRGIGRGSRGVTNPWTTEAGVNAASSSLKEKKDAEKKREDFFNEAFGALGGVASLVSNSVLFAVSVSIAADSGLVPKGVTSLSMDEASDNSSSATLLPMLSSSVNLVPSAASTAKFNLASAVDRAVVAFFTASIAAASSIAICCTISMVELT